jgi:hypothetical protein
MHETYDATRYGRDARTVIGDINSRGKLAVVAGGTGLYLRALIGSQFHDLPTDSDLRADLAKLSTSELFDEFTARDPERAGALHQNDRVRILRAVELVKLMGRPIGAMVTAAVPQFPAKVSIYLNPSRPNLHEVIAERSRRMLEKGLIEEVESLLKGGCPPTIKPMQSIGYAQVAVFTEPDTGWLVYELANIADYEVLPIARDGYLKIALTRDTFDENDELIQEKSTLFLDIRGSRDGAIKAEEIRAGETPTDATVILATSDEFLINAASIDYVERIRGQSQEVKVFSVSGRDPAMNGAYLNVAIFVDMATGWNVYELANVLLYCQACETVT